MLGLSPTTILAEEAEATDWVYAVIKDICKGERENDWDCQTSGGCRRDLFHNPAAKIGLNIFPCPSGIPAIIMVFIVWQNRL